MTFTDHIYCSIDQASFSGLPPLLLHTASNQNLEAGRPGNVQFSQQEVCFRNKDRVYRVEQGFHFCLFQKQCGGGLQVVVHLFLQLSCQNEDTPMHANEKSLRLSQQEQLKLTLISLKTNIPQAELTNPGPCKTKRWTHHNANSYLHIYSLILSLFPR